MRLGVREMLGGAWFSRSELKCFLRSEGVLADLAWIFYSSSLFKSANKVFYCIALFSSLSRCSNFAFCLAK